jgi:hypothetical protein
LEIEHGLLAQEFDLSRRRVHRRPQFCPGPDLDAVLSSVPDPAAASHRVGVKRRGGWGSNSIKILWANSWRGRFGRNLGELEHAGKTNPGARCPGPNSPTVSIATHAPETRLRRALSGC